MTHHNTTTTAATGNPSLGDKIVGHAERAVGHMLPGTDLGHQLKAEGALKTGDAHKAAKASADMDHHGLTHRHDHVQQSDGHYAEGVAQRAAGHIIPGQEGHKLKAAGAMNKGDMHTADKAASHLDARHSAV
ncbi:hypothetical protein HDU87_002729 [Geranomyces variabilis]|uniref:Uncharacterized protein n=1 Tax=Geranomyces variabilis TaxID=109894 RepID=A0AAD5TRR9_9FUNG|nr:hypothetical protein HDU87_002729 [Geranomyces variabilis]